MRVAFIPARGGSKGIPGKNIKLFAGKPLISWTINAASNCNLIDKVIVSTDHKETARISISYGAEVPFIRPKKLATDQSPIIDTIIHFLKTDPKVSEILLLQPTSPLRRVSDIKNIIQRKIDKSCNSIVSITEAYNHPHLCYKILKSDAISPLIPNKKLKRRQELPKIYCLNGSIYLANRNFILEKNSFINEETIGYLMPKERSVDIDNIYDWIVAETLFKKLNG